MSTTVVVVEDDDGIHGDVLYLDLKSTTYMGYDEASAAINAVLESDVDGPEQMELIIRIANKFLERNA